MGKPFTQVDNIKVSHFADVLVPDAIRERFTFQPSSLAFRTFAKRQELVSPFLSGRRFVIVHHVSQVLDNAIEGNEIIGRRMNELLFNSHIFKRTIENLVHSFLGNVANRSVKVTRLFLQPSLGWLITLKNGANLPENHLVLVFSKWHDSPIVNAQFRIGDNLFEVNFAHIAKSFAFRTSTLGRVEREDIGSRFAIRHTCNRVHQTFRKVANSSSFLVHQGAISLFHGHLNAFPQSFVVFFLHLEFVNHHFNVVVLVSVDFHAARDFQHVTIHANIQISFAPHRFE